MAEDKKTNSFWSEYWKSQPKKFCEFCKCWITDNKPSVQFHEKGKKHQENVRLKIEEVRKKGTIEAKRKEEENDYMKQMEQDTTCVLNNITTDQRSPAALEAFKKDLADNPELAEKYNVKIPEDKETVYEGPQLPDNWAEISKANAVAAAKHLKEKEKAEKGEWYEAMSDMGYPYYWNTVTGESIWEAPEKYVSIKEQGAEEDTAESNTDNNDEKTDTADTASTTPPAVEDIPLPPGIESIPLPGEITQPVPPSTEDSKQEEKEDEEEEDIDVKQDRHARGIYGTWARVHQEHTEQVDLQLPKTQEAVDIVNIPVAVPEDKRLKFKEKHVTLSSRKSGPVAFKKRKLGDGARNVRRRDADD